VHPVYRAMGGRVRIRFHVATLGAKS
jgi:hypothetical protein